MSTPRTDAAYIECVRDSIEGVYFDDGRFRKFARRLETELTAALAAKEKAEQELDEARKTLAFTIHASEKYPHCALAHFVEHSLRVRHEGATKSAEGTPHE